MLIGSLIGFPFNSRHLPFINGLRRISKLDFFLFEFLQQLKIDLLLNFHINIIISAQHIINDFNIQTKISESLKMSSVKNGPLDTFNDFADNNRNFTELFEGSLVNDPKLKKNAAPFHSFV